MRECLERRRHLQRPLDVLLSAGHGGESNDKLSDSLHA
jgi:hypothetical protein